MAELAEAPPAPAPPPIATITAESDWRPFAPEDVKADLKALEPVKNLGDLIKTAVHSQKAAGRALWLPEKDAKPEDVAKAKTDILGKLRAANMLEGAPEGPDKYTIERPDFAGAVGWDDDAEKDFRQEMHKAGATNPQVQAAINAYTRFVLKQVSAEHAERKRVDEALAKEWGPNHKPNLGMANKAVQLLDDEIGAKGEFIGLLQASNLADHPWMVKAMHWLGRSMWEHGVIDGVTNVTGADEAETEMQKMLTDPQSPLNQRGHPGQADAVERYLALNRIVMRKGR